VHAARRRESAGAFARVRDRAIRRAADSIAEQRTLWTLRHPGGVTLVYPSNLSADGALSIRDDLLARASTAHARGLAIHGAALVVSGALTVIPGPNLVAYYFAFRLVGHYFSWRGARRAAPARWDLRSDPALVELATLADLPRDARASRVAAIGGALGLPSLAAFFDRLAVPARS
jgi:hypothetical protein